VPAPELARQLGVSVRTIYRDMDALSAAGIPVYAERGAEGGCCLVEDYHTDLTGLNEDEARALFLLSAPGPLDALEVGQKLRSALHKLAAALPGYRSGAGGPARIHLDWTAWGRGVAGGAHLGLLYRAVQRGEQVRLAYRLPPGFTVEALVCPLGLVAKAGAWHLAWQIHPGKLRWQAVDDLLAVTPSGLSFTPPAGFDLQAAWQEHLADWEAWRGLYRVAVRITPAALEELRRRGVPVVFDAAPPDAEGRLAAELAFDSLETACRSLVGLGRAVVVLSPAPLRLTISDYAQQILELYPAPGVC
jgi:predicted DNA-binding transcriptional regulator YafY